MSPDIRKKQRILIADDSEMNRMLLIEMLGEQFDVTEAENGVQAVAALQEQGAEFSLLLLDIMMPEMDGFEVLAFMNRYHWIDDIPVIIISSETSPSYIERAYDFGATDYISRPFDAVTVYHRVTNTILLSAKQHRLMNIVTEQLYEREKSNNLMITILSHLVEFRNGESGLHVLHINTITNLLLRRLIQKTDRYGLSNADVSLISTASTLHDIGKISIPTEILNKPGRLTAEEFAITKTHSLIGAQMLDQLPEEQREEPLVKVAYQICRWHHERYDGGGYPDGLKGDAIPISAQVVSLADVYDALTSQRCYKPAFPHEQAMGMILDGQCGAFNPLLLECLTEIGDTLKKEMHIKSHSDQELHHTQLIAERLHEYELVSSERMLEQLEYERKRFLFLSSSSTEIVFTYTAVPPLLSFNSVGALRFGLGEEVLVDPLNNEKFRSILGEEDLGRLRQAVAAARPENPTACVDLSFRVGREQQWFRCIWHGIWFSGHDDAAGAVGKLIDVDAEYRQVDRQQTSTFQRIMGLCLSNGFTQTTDGYYSIRSAEALLLIQYLQVIFDSVHLVDAAAQRRISIGKNGELVETPYNSEPDKGAPGHHDSTVAARCVFERRRIAKFEFLDDAIYHILAIYLEIDGQPYALEMISAVADDTILSGSGKLELVESISRHNKRLYIDPVTGAYNRRYYEEQLSQLHRADAAAFMDVDKFKHINDSYGHQIGDIALHAIASAVAGCVRRSDALVRYGGDEFVVVFLSIPQNVFETKLREISAAVQALSIPEAPDLTFSVSVGGVYGPDSTARLVAKADELMYRSKNGSGGITLEVVCPDSSSEREALE